MNTLNDKNCQLVLVDMQEKLLPAIQGYEQVLDNCVKMARFADICGFPVLATEQYPKGLGPTVEPLRNAVGSFYPIEKITFGCFGCEEFTKAVQKSNLQKIVVCGIETHVCVCQTVLEGLRQGFEMYLVTDGVSSRHTHDRETGIRRMIQAGAVPVTTEMVIYEILGRAGTDRFKKTLELIK